MKGLLFTYGLTYGGALASLYRPYWGFLIYVAFAILRPEFLWYWSVPAGNYSRIIAIALLTGWALHGFGNWRFGRGWPIACALVGYLAWQVVSGLSAEDRELAFGQIELQAKIILPAMVGLTLIGTVAQLRQLAWVIVLSMGMVAFEANLSYLSGNNWLRISGFGSMDNNSISIGMVSVAGMAFFLGLAEKSWPLRWLAFGIAGLLVHCPIMANSRGGMLGLVVTGLVTFVLIPKRPQEYALLALACVAAILMMGPEVRERFATSFASAEQRDESADSRLELWKACWDVMKNHPLLGVGPEHWPLTAKDYGWPSRKECHSLWFNAGAELGFPGVGLLLAFYWLAMLRSYQLIRSPQARVEPWLAAVGRLAVAALCGFMVSASFVSLDNLEPPYYVAMMAAGAWKVVATLRSDGRDRLTQPGPHVGPVAAGLAG